jgi:hypothetical protein
MYEKGIAQSRRRDTTEQNRCLAVDEPQLSENVES